jgi:hypothetical protein
MMRTWIIILLLPVWSWAQEADNAERSTTHVGAMVGRFLPYGIYGVRDTYPYWGLRFGHSFSIFNPEYAVTAINAKGVTYYTGSLSLSYPSELEGLKMIAFVGGDINYYQGRTNVRKLPFATIYGGHLGVAPMIDINRNLFFRADIKMNFGPGRSLHVGGGLVYYF